MERWLELELKGAYGIYRTQQAISRHFGAGSYDFFKYGGNIKASFESFCKRKDKQHYIRLQKRISQSNIDPVTFIISNVKDGKVPWVGTIASANGNRNAVAFDGKLSQMGRNTINALKDHVIDECIDNGRPFKELIKAEGMEIPYVVQRVLDKDLGILEFIALDNAIGILKANEHNFDTNWVLDEFATQVNQIRGFLKYDKADTKYQLAVYLKDYWN